MFTNKLKMDSLSKAAGDILEDTVRNIKISTPTGTKVLGGRYGSAKAHLDQTRKDIDVLKGPKKSELNKIDKEKPVKEEKHDDEAEDKALVKKMVKKDCLKNESFKSKLLEREMTSAETKKREKIVMSMKDKEGYFKKKYGKRWKDVMYATATKTAMKEETDQIDESELSTDTLRGRVDGAAKANDFKSFKVKLKGDEIQRPQQGQEPAHSAARTSIEAHGGAVPQPQIKVGEEVEKKPSILDRMKKATAHYDSLKSSVAAKTPSGEIKTTKSTVKEDLEESKDPERDAGVGSPAQFVQNENPSSNPAPKHTPLSRVKEVTKLSMSKLKSEMLGKAPGNN